MAMRSPRFFLVCSLFLALCVRAHAAASATSASSTEWILLVGGPSIHQWEQYKSQPHDHWWANFVHAARLRTEQLRKQLGPNARITWLVYKQGYVDRAQQEHQDLLSYVESIRDKFNVNLVWFEKGPEVISYLNSGLDRRWVKVEGFEYFGHSNKACFMFDYSSNVDSSSKVWLHESDLTKIDRHIFTRTTFAKSWGCHTGEEMSKRWFNATGTKMIGAIGKTQFMMEELPILTSENGYWSAPN
jgi:hypothetical protein